MIDQGQRVKLLSQFFLATDTMLVTDDRAASMLSRRAWKGVRKMKDENISNLLSYTPGGN